MQFSAENCTPVQQRACSHIYQVTLRDTIGFFFKIENALHGTHFESAVATRTKSTEVLKGLKEEKKMPNTVFINEKYECSDESNKDRWE